MFWAELHGQRVSVASISGTEEVSVGYDFTVVVYTASPLHNLVGLSFDLSITEHLRSGIIYEYESLHVDVHKQFYYRCSFCSPLQYYGRFRHYSIHHDSSFNLLTARFLAQCRTRYNIRSMIDRQYDYFVQYHDTTEIVVRYLAASNGIYYFFRHSMRDPELILTAHDAHSVRKLKLVNVEQGIDEKTHNYITKWEVIHRLTTLAHQSYGFDIHNPEFEISGSYVHDEKMSDERYYTDITSHEHARMRARHVVESSKSRLYRTTTKDPGIYAGSEVDLSGGEDSGTYFVIKVEHKYNGDIYVNDCICSKGFVSQQVELNKPRGMEIATVVAPLKDGKVKVKFNWCKDVSADIPILQGSCGNGYGTLFTPRVGQRVAVIFEGGDASRPFICGAFYNGSHVPPYSGEYCSTIKTKSFDDTCDKFNELIFDDEPGCEKIKIHACNALEEDIVADKCTHIHNGSMNIALDSGMYKLELGSDQNAGHHIVSLNTGDSKLKISRGSHIIELDCGDLRCNIDCGNVAISINDGQVLLEVPQVTIKTSNLVIESGEVDVNAGKMNVSSQDRLLIAGRSVEIVSAEGITISSDSQIEMKSSIIKLN